MASTPCMTDGCDQPAKWQVGFRMWAAAMPRQQRTLNNCLEMKTGLCVCDSHKREIKGADFFPPESKERIASALQGQGYLLPDFDHASPVFDEIIDKPLDIDEAMSALKASGAKVTES